MPRDIEEGGENQPWCSAGARVVTRSCSGGMK